MGQIVKRKKKGRPSKADLGTRNAPLPEIELRRSHRRRNVKYLFDLDDYFDDEGIFEDDEDLKRREKKLKLLLKVDDSKDASGTPPYGADAKFGRAGRMQHSPRHSASSSDCGDGPSKKQKIGGDADFEGNDVNGGVGKVFDRKPKPRDKDWSSGKLTAAVLSGFPLPDKKELELILDKLQKKDIYGVYAEPVDPEEIPGYHDVIKNPMDFTTVRNKLSNGLYLTLDQFEARNIQELAKKKFYKRRLYSHSAGMEIKPEQKMNSGSGLNEQMKSSMNQMMQETSKSDYLIGATLGKAVSIPHITSALLAVGSDRPTVLNRLVESSLFLHDSNLGKAEESLPVGKGALSRSGRKLLVLEENRRETYDISLAQDRTCSESAFSTFDRESKELVAVGVYSDHSYARSLVRFAATLGPVAWKIASKRIELSLPKEYKFGRGWVGEFEPPPTPVLMLDKCNVGEPAFFSKKDPANDSGRHEKLPAVSVSSKAIPGISPFVQNDQAMVGSIKRASTLPVKAHRIKENLAEGESSPFISPGNKPDVSHNHINQHQNFQPKKSGLKQVELGEPSSFNRNATSSMTHLQTSKSSEMGVVGPVFISSNVNISSSGSNKLPDNIKGVAAGGLANGKMVCNGIDSNSVVSSSSGLANGGCFYPQEQGQCLIDDQIQMMKMFTEMAQNQQESSNRSSADASLVFSPASNRDSAAAAAARVWMSVGAGGFRPDEKDLSPFQDQTLAYPLNQQSTHDMHSRMSRFQGQSNASGLLYHPDNSSFPLNASVTQGQRPVGVDNSTQFPSQLMRLPPYPNADLSNYQLQSVWKNLNPHLYSSQNQELHPPNPGVVRQSPGSPRKPSSGVLLDSQQPDLALQL